MITKSTVRPLSLDSRLTDRARVADSTAWAASAYNGVFASGVEKLNRAPQPEWGCPISGDDLALIKDFQGGAR